MTERKNENDRTEQRREEDLSLHPQTLLGNIDPITSSRTNLPAATTTAVAAAVSGRKRLFSPAETSRIEISLGAAGPPEHAALLKDLFWTLYSKLAAVLEGHRVMYEVSRWISSVGPFFSFFYFLQGKCLKVANPSCLIFLLATGFQGQHDSQRFIYQYSSIGNVAACPARSEYRLVGKTSRVSTTLTILFIYFR